MYTHTEILNLIHQHIKNHHYKHEKEQITLYMNNAYKIAVGTNICFNHIIINN